MNILSIFVTWQFLVMCVSISAVTFVFRRIIEFAILDNPKMPGTSSSRIWRDLVLVLFPVFVGMLFGLIFKKFPYPAGLIDGVSKFMFSSSAGLLSPIVYRAIKSALVKTAGSVQASNSTGPSLGEVANDALKFPPQPTEPATEDSAELKP